MFTERSSVGLDVHARSVVAHEARTATDTATRIASVPEPRWGRCLLRRGASLAGRASRVALDSPGVLLIIASGVGVGLHGVKLFVVAALREEFVVRADGLDVAIA